MAKPTTTTPTMADVIQTMIDASLVETHTCLPAKVVLYNPLTQTADVLPSLMRKYEGDLVAKPLPVIPNVPVVHPKTKLAHVHMPLSTGDDVLLIFSERSLDKWKLTGTIMDPMDRRKHNLTDAFAIAGGSGLPFSFSVSDPTAVEIVNGLNSASIGLVKVKVETPVSKVTLDPTTAKIESGVAEVSLTPTGQIKLGKVAPFSVALAENVLARLIALETKLNAHIALYNLHVHNIIAPTPGTPTAIPIPVDVPMIPIPDPIGSVLTKVQV